MFSFTSLLLEWLKVGGLRRRKQGGTKTHSQVAVHRKGEEEEEGGKWPFHPPLFAFREREIHSWARIYCLPHGQSQGEERRGRPGLPPKNVAATIPIYIPSFSETKIVPIPPTFWAKENWTEGEGPV